MNIVAIGLGGFNLTERTTDGANGADEKGKVEVVLLLLLNFLSESFVLSVVKSFRPPMNADQRRRRNCTERVQPSAGRVRLTSCCA